MPGTDLWHGKTAIVHLVLVARDRSFRCPRYLRVTLESRPALLCRTDVNIYGMQTYGAMMGFDNILCTSCAPYSNANANLSFHPFFRYYGLIRPALIKVLHLFRNSGLVRAASDVMVNGVTLTDKYGLTRQYLIGDPLFGAYGKRRRCIERQIWTW